MFFAPTSPVPCLVLGAVTLISPTARAATGLLHNSTRSNLVLVPHNIRKNITLTVTPCLEGVEQAEVQIDFSRDDRPAIELEPEATLRFKPLDPGFVGAAQVGFTLSGATRCPGVETKAMEEPISRVTLNLLSRADGSEQQSTALSPLSGLHGNKPRGAARLPATNSKLGGLPLTNSKLSAVPATNSKLADWVRGHSWLPGRPSIPSGRVSFSSNQPPKDSGSTELARPLLKGGQDPEAEIPVDVLMECRPIPGAGSGVFRFVQVGPGEWRIEYATPSEESCMPCMACVIL